MHTLHIGEEQMQGGDVGSSASTTTEKPVVHAVTNQDATLLWHWEDLLEGYAHHHVLANAGSELLLR